jgi:ribosomal protein S18 acetylase RimI-like enzyme
MSMSRYEVRLAGSDDREAVLGTLMLAFGADPCMRYALDTSERFLAGFKTMATAMGGGAFDCQGAYVADEAGAAALWLAPGQQSDGETIGELVARIARPEKLEVLAQVGEQMREHHPHEPHWYLAMIGTDPLRQGRGLGSALLEAALARCDAEGAMAYRVCSNPANIPLYERFGFRVTGLIQPADFPPLVPMVRPAGG